MSDPRTKTSKERSRVPTTAGGFQIPDEVYIPQWLARIKARCVANEKGCLVWQGFLHTFKNQKPGQPGYAGSAYRGKSVRVHRKVLELKLGRDLPTEIQACHTCDNPPCCNEDHLYPGTNQQNHLDGGKRKRMQGQTKTHCKNGHEFTPENTFVDHRPGGGASRQCRECNRIRQRTNHAVNPELGRERARRARLKRKIKAHELKANDVPEKCGGKCPRHGPYVLLGRKGPCPICEEIKQRDSEKASKQRELTLHDFGYAPGNYSIKCLDCGQEALWCDKRASRCETCAKQALAENRKGLSESEGEQHHG